MKNNINVFVHTLEDIGYFFKELYDKNNNYVIYATHAGVVEYIKEKYNADAVLLSSLITQQEIDSINVYTNELCQETIRSLDKEYSQAISKKFNISNLNFFAPLYSYHLPYILSGLFIFKELLLKIDKRNENIIFDYTDSFYGVFTLREFIGSSLKNNSVKLNWYKANKTQKNKSKLIIKIIKNLDKVYNRFLDIVNEYLAYISVNKKTILYMDGLYDFSFIKSVHKFRLIPYGYQALSHKFTTTTREDIVAEDISKIFKVVNSVKQENDIEWFIANLLMKDFVKKSQTYQTGLKILDNLMKKNTINLAIWGNPPVFGFKALFYEYCMAKGIKVLGVQHGANYIDQNFQQQHYYSDFIRCSHYISYGFKQEDLKRNFSSFNIKNLTVYSLGSTKSFKSNLKFKKQEVDVLFPVTNSISMLEGAFLRVKPDILHSNQMSILSLLEEESKKNSISSLVKPFRNTSILQTSVFFELKKLRYAKVDWNKNFTKILEEVNAKCVILELMSTPLYEVIGHDIEIFLFVADTDNLTDKAKEMLEKRVYIVANFDEFKVVFQKWIEKNLPKKRDSSYYDYYVHKDNSKSNILELLKNI
ncbi:MAG: hypothetical protein NTW78_10865 [Campylobacterales bacterium]|nr:hypothetical protein [Campylobacterales bacterium]